MFEQSLAAKVDGVECNGLEGLNLSLTAPFKFMESVVGMKGKINDLRNLKAENVFIKRSIDNVDVNVDSASIPDVTGTVNWSDDQFEIEAKGNSRDMFTDFWIFQENP